MEPDQVPRGVQHGDLGNLAGSHEIEYFGAARGLVHRHEILTHSGVQTVAVERLAGEQRATNIAVGDRAYDAAGGVADERDAATTLIDRAQSVEQRVVGTQ